MGQAVVGRGEKRGRTTRRVRGYGMRWYRFVTLAVVIGVVAFGAGSPVSSSKSGQGKDLVERFSFEGQKRAYLLHLPSGYDKKKPLPLVVALHYYTGTGRAEAEQTGFSAKADEERFIVAYPDGPIPGPTGLSWDIWHNPRDKQGSGDVAFVRELIRRLSARFAVDPKRIYVSGMSQGGMVAHLVGCELSSVIAAIAPVGAFLTAQPRSADPVSVLIIHGTADPVVPYRGGTLGGGTQRRGGGPRRGGRGRTQGAGGGRLPIPPVSETASIWVAHNGCSPKAKKTQQGKVIKELYTGGKAGTEVAVYTIVGGGHDWPGDRNDKSGSGLEATDAVWEFFEKHPKR